MIHQIPAMKKNMPRNGGKILRMRRYNPLPTALVPLGNTGVTPPAVTLTAVDIDAQIQFYGQYIQLNEQVTLQNEDPKMYGVYKLSLIDLEAYGVS
jgi:N4-gp56 family major capsid protein